MYFLSIVYVTLNYCCDIIIILEVGQFWGKKVVEVTDFCRAFGSGLPHSQSHAIAKWYAYYCACPVRPK